MAWIRKPGEETEDQPIVSGQGAGTLGISSAGTTGQGTPQRGTGFSDLKKYLEANKGAAAGLGEKISGRLAKEGQDVTSAQQTAETGLESALSPIESFDAAKTAQNVLTPLSKSWGTPISQTQQATNFGTLGKAGIRGLRLGGLTQGGATFNAPFANAPSANQLATEMYSKGGQYTGPQSVDYGKALTEASEAENLAKGAESEAGRFSMLRDLGKGRPVKTGNINLDQAILQSDPTAMQRVTEAASGLKGLSGKVSEAGAKNVVRIGQAKEKAGTDWKTLQSAFNPKAKELSDFSLGLQNTINDLQQRLTNFPQSSPNNIVANRNRDMQLLREQIQSQQRLLDEVNSRKKALKNIMGS